MIHTSEQSLRVRPKVLFPCSIPGLGLLATIPTKEVVKTALEISKLSEEIVFQIGDGPCQIKIEAIFDPEEVERLNVQHGTDSLFGSIYYLIFSTEIVQSRFEGKSMRGDEVIELLTLEKHRAFYEQILCEEFASHCIYFLFLSHLARAGCILTDRPILEYDTLGFKRIRQGLNCYLEGPIEIARKVKWAEIKSLSLSDVWSWANGFPDGEERFGYTAVGRALCAFSHLFDKKSSMGMGENAVKLFWAMIGLEALYTSGKGDLTHQLVEKTQVIFGKQEQFKTIVKKMYAFRSRFVHGDAPFPSHFFEYTGAPVYEAYSEEAGDAVNMAIAILIASLQYLIERKLYSLNFGYVLEP